MLTHPLTRALPRRCRPGARAWTLAALATSVALGTTAVSQASVAPLGDVSGRPVRSGSVPGEVIVRFKRSASGAQRVAAVDGVRARITDRLRREPLRLLRLPRGRTVAGAIRRLERSPAVAFAEPNRIIHSFGTSNDPFLSEQYSLHNFGQQIGQLVTGTGDADMDVLEAWDITTGSRDVLVAVVDSGIAYDSPELAPNLFVNAGESGGGKETNGLDDDGNGFVDDVRGWDFTDDDNDPRDLGLFPHGTVASSVIGAVGNNGQGVSGVAQQARILPARVFDIDGTGTTFRSAQAFEYAGAMDARIVNASFGGAGFSQAQSDAIANAPDTLFVAAAGNEGADNDAVAVHPCNDPNPNVLCIAATDENAQLADFSNFGATQVDLGAPGVGVIAAAPSYEDEFADDFETALTGRWTSGGTNNTWQRTNASASSGSFSLTDSPGGDYSNNTASFIRTDSSFSLVGNVGCRLDFQLKLDSEPGIDGILIDASTDAASWTNLTGFSGSSSGDFISADADLTAFQGESTVYLRLRFVSDSSIVGDGAYVDDLAVHCLGSSYDGDELIYANGTSFSAPNVAGIGALALTLAPDLSVVQLKDALMAGVDANSALAGKTVTGGQANALGTLSKIKPTAATGGATDVGRTVATLHGTIAPRGQATRFAFEYGPTTSYGKRTAEFSAGDAAASQPVSASIGDLSAGINYHYRLIATNGAGTTTGADQAFATTASVPTAAARDRSPPTAGTPRVRVTRKGKATLTFSLSEPVTFAGLVTGQKGKPRAISSAKEVAAGAQRLGLGRLAAGRYVAAFTLRDQTGNRSRPFAVRFTVRKAKPRTQRKRPPAQRSGSAPTAAAHAASIAWLPPLGAGEGAPGYKLPNPPAPVQYDSPSKKPAALCDFAGCIPVRVSTCGNSPCLDGPDPNAPKTDDPRDPSNYEAGAPITESRAKELKEIKRFLEAEGSKARRASDGGWATAVGGALIPNPVAKGVVTTIGGGVAVGSGASANDLFDMARLIGDELDDKEGKVVPDGTPGAIPKGADVTQLPDLGRDRYVPGACGRFGCGRANVAPPPPKIAPSPYRPPSSSSLVPRARLSAAPLSVRIPRPVVPKLPGVSAKGRRDVANLLANLSASGALRRAVKKSAAAASAAARAENRQALDRDVLAIRIHAARLVSLLRAEPGLRRKAARALHRFHFKLTLARARQIQRQVARRGLPAKLRKFAARGGLNPRQIAREIAKANPKSLTGNFPVLINTPEARRAALLDANAYASIANAR